MAAAGEMADSGGTQVAEGEAGDGKTYGGQEAYDKAEKALQANEELAARTGSSSTHSYKDAHAVFKNINGDNVVEILGGAEIDATVGSSLQAYNQAHGGGWRVALGACRLATTCTIYRRATVTSTGYGGLNYQRTYSASTRSSVESVIATMAHEYGHYRGFADHETSDPYQKTYGYQQTQAINAFRGY